MTPVRLYAKQYASKVIFGWLYIVEPVGEMERSDHDTVETYHSPACRVLRVSERAVQLTMSERRHLYAMWKAADQLAGGAGNELVDWQMERLLGVRR
jgi:hypothetical protein